MPTGVLVDSLCQETMNMGWYGKEQIRIQKHVELKSMHYIIFNCLLVIINHYESLLIIIGHLISLLSHYLLYKSQLWNQILHDIPIWLMSHEKYLCPRPSCWLVELPITDWWKWCCHWRQWQRTMQHPTFGRGIDRHPGCCRHCGCHRSDGTVVATGRNRRGQCEIPPLDEGIVYTQIAAGHFHTVLLRSDGSAVAVGLQRSAVCKTPADIRRSNVSISHSPYVFAPMATALHKSGCSWGRVLSFDCTGDWLSLGEAQKDCSRIEDEPLESPPCFAWRAVDGQDLPNKSSGFSC